MEELSQVIGVIKKLNQVKEPLKNGVIANILQCGIVLMITSQFVLNYIPPCYRNLFFQSLEHETIYTEVS